jgi:hypothetical protein
MKHEEIEDNAEEIYHKLYVDNFLLSPDILYLMALHTTAISCCGTVRQNCEG